MTSKNSERNGINSDVNGVDVGSDRNTEKGLDTLLNMNRGHRVEPPALKVVEPPSISKGNTKLLMYTNCHLHVSVILTVVLCCMCSLVVFFMFNYDWSPYRNHHHWNGQGVMLTHRSLWRPVRAKVMATHCQGEGHSVLLYELPMLFISSSPTS